MALWFETVTNTVLPDQLFRRFLLGKWQRRQLISEIMVWNSFMAKRGWRDQATASLNRWKAELGFRDRNDIQTFFDLYDADEEREISSTYPPDL
jgi:Domain of unknown function (DUF5069)